MIKRLSGNELVEPSISAFSLTRPCHSGHFHKGLFLHQTITRRLEAEERELVCVCRLLDRAEFFPPHHLPHPLGSASCASGNLIQIPKVWADLAAPEGGLNDWVL